MPPASLRIAVFLHGTVLMHAGGVGRSRDERVRQVRDGTDPSLRAFASYVPIGLAAERLCAWQRQGAAVSYISSHRRPEDVENDWRVLRAHGFPEGPIHYRAAGEPYAAVAERILPDVLVVDDCESIGGEPEMVAPHIRPEVKAGRTWIVVKEFGGIDHLPNDVAALLRFRG